MADTRRAAVRSPRIVSTDAAPAFICFVCDTPLHLGQERVIVTHYPPYASSTWCLPCWDTLLMAAHEWLRP